LLASTFVGGGSDEFFSTLAIDSEGNIYITGSTESDNYPTTEGAFDNTFNDDIGDIFISKLSPDLSQLLASTYIGGSESDDAYSLAVDNTGNVYVAGQTHSDDFPCTGDAYDKVEENFDAFIVKFDADLDTLLASTFLGGDGYDKARSLSIDDEGNVYVAGTCGLDFPTTEGAYQRYNKQGWYSDVFISKLNASFNKLLASTLIGGSYNDYFRSMVRDSEGNIYVAGWTDSNDYPSTPGAYDPDYSGDKYNLVISKIDSDLSHLSASTFLGDGVGFSGSQTVSLAIDDSNNIYMACSTDSPNYPTTSKAFNTTSNGSWDVYVAKLSSSLSTLSASTFIGGDELDILTSLALDNSGNVYIAGYTRSTDYPVIVGGYDPDNNNGWSYAYFITKLQADLSSVEDSTFLGGCDHTVDHSPIILLCLAEDGNIYAAGVTYSSWPEGRSFPMAVDYFDTLPYDWTYNGGYDVFISKLTPDLSSDVISGLPAKDVIGTYGRVNIGVKISDPVDSATGAHVIERKLLTLNGAQTLLFKVGYNSLLLNEGPLGKGWGHDFETNLEVLPNGNVKIHWDANHVNTFFNNGNDRFSPADSAMRFDKLVKNSDGTYTLTRKDQKAYQFDTAGKLTKVQNGHGQSLTLAYDTSGRLATVEEPLSGQAFTLHYNTDGFIDQVTDSLNRQVSFTYDANHYLTGITDAGGQTTTYTYNGDGQVLTAVDAEGRQLFTNTYDDKGRVITQDDTIEGNQLTRFSYDESTRPGELITTVTDRNGNTRVFVYDNNYSLISETDELGNTTTYTYDDDGNRTGITDAKGNTTTFTYDDRGNLLTATDPVGNVTKMTYDDRNNLLSVENAAGKKIVYSYDDNNNLTSVTDPMGNTTTYTYDENGLLLSKTTPGSGITTYAYQNGLLHAVTDPAGNTTTYGYDAAGRLVTVTGAAGNTTTMSYDNADNPVSVTDPLGNTATYSYDSHHNKLSETDANGNTTRFIYNGNGKLISKIDPLGNETRYEYDGEDRLVRVIDARGNAITYSYDAKGRVIGITDPLGNTRCYEYDALGNLIGETDALGNKINTTNYDVRNNPTTITDALGNTITNQYDNLNRLVCTINPLGRITHLKYDDLNRLVSTTDVLGGTAMQSFDADGNRIALVDPNDNQTSYSFDKAGRLTNLITAAGSKTTYSYNAQNLIAQITNGRGQKTTYQYDDAGRLTSLTDPAGTVTYTYDANGNVLTINDSTGTISREYDALNRVVKYTDSQGNTIRYTYDAVGNLVTLTYPGGKQVQYGYDAGNRLTSVTDWAGRVTAYEYDANGRLVKTSRPDGSILTLSYDTAGQLLQQKDVDKNGNIIVQYDFTYDAAGNVKTEQSVTEPKPFTLPNKTMTYSGDNRLATYNGKPVEYDTDGNMIKGPLAGGLDNYTYDARNRLTSAGNTSYIYDAENNRISVTDSVYQDSYVINPQAPLSQVLIKTDAQGEQTFYIYGLGLIGQEDCTGVYRTYHFDRRGSTVAITDIDGNVTDRFQYGPYGELVYRDGITHTPFLYNGRDGVMTDSNGLYYMRARYYSPEIKRFINRDVLTGSIDNGQSLNRYAYVDGRPVSFVDPFGLSKDSDNVLYQVGNYVGKVLDYYQMPQEYVADKFIKPYVKWVKRVKSVNNTQSSLLRSYMKGKGVSVINQAAAIGELSENANIRKISKYTGKVTKGVGAASKVSSWWQFWKWAKNSTDKKALGIKVKKLAEAGKLSYDEREFIQTCHLGNKTIEDISYSDEQGLEAIATGYMQISHNGNYILVKGAEGVLHGTNLIY